MSETISKTFVWRGRIYAYAPLILWIGVIFFLSSSAGSMSNTSRFVRPLLEFLFPDAPEAVLLVYHGYVRKLAHVTEYAILAFLAARAFSLSTTDFLRRFWFLFAFVLVLLVAIADETNQSFLASRTGSPFDVMLDAGGGLTAIILFWLWRSLKNKSPEK
jgi:VanZ family protein